MLHYLITGRGTDGQPLCLLLPARTREEAREQAAQIDLDGVRFQTIDDDIDDIEKLPPQAP
jgi:hypothetical protein